ncbi:MAG: UDP-N-acetylglucosamine 2-epimerase (non-hydrolyzing) [Candidatus Marinimicrobia bacterium]|nr:UDP-N-acetylglucosamine 2-epimerase (non-hydrolyzing) [Candidatus Neomarinimicrobiota bacterium]
MKLIHVVGARPNFMKAAPVWSAIHRMTNFNQILVHTGQHYDRLMSKVFFKELQMPTPDHNLNIGSDSHARQTAAIMIKFEELVNELDPNMVLVYGDVNSTVAAAMVCSKLMIPFAHIEAGLRSFDRRMPEEINRLITDQLADLLFTPSMDGDVNLNNEGIPNSKIHCVGNVMIDTLVKLLPKADKPNRFKDLKQYVLVTLHRPSNVDDFESLKSILQNLEITSNSIPIIFPVHPRTKKIITANNLDIIKNINFHLIEPLGYLEFLGLMKNATAVITDSGGIQEETTYLDIPCITLRENTERPITISLGTNQLIGKDYNKLPNLINDAINVKKRSNTIIPLWDGKASDRIAEILLNNI